ncbi:hypothetical protein C2G38_2176649 [Gigaspora rosea]|uniref:Uncharacterized protein n=1 Tax=Gigaspora rosea TaxID=44941 RepID=A0A397VG49_9GLOM|nr:hypothetical protein C2G38_2176649 [Gigaspora rosea]
MAAAPKVATSDFSQYNVQGFWVLAVLTTGSLFRWSLIFTLSWFIINLNRLSQENLFGIKKD